ncbi:ZGRF1 protein, partial [Baryphthengus martii]|nr:ZGRF1 protein [Baryphthengus martii]
LLLQPFTHLKQVLYTHQKMKKSKTWQDGILRIRAGRNKAVLFDDKGQCLESVFINSQLNAGDNLESERYLITVEALKVNEEPPEDQARQAETPAVAKNSVKPGVPPPRHLPVGLKRKYTGFQAPRQVEKKIATTEGGENPTTLPLSKQCQGTFPSKFYVTSPLFSTFCKKDEETHLSADFHGDVRSDSDREDVSLSSLLSAPVLGRCEGTEKQNSGQFVVKPEPPVITGHVKPGSWTAGHGAVSHNIRSTAQIIALLKPKAAQGCREEATSECSECPPRFRALENAAGLYNHQSTIPPAFSGHSAERLVQNIQCLPFIKGTANDKEWNAEMLLNSAEQPCDKECPGQRCYKKAGALRQDLQDPCNTNSCFLPEFTISRMSDSQYVPSSGDILCSPSPSTFEKNPSGYREHSVTAGLQESSPAELQSELWPGQNSERVPSDLELSVGGTLTDVGLGEAAAQNAALTFHSVCEVATLSENEELQCSTSDRENDGNHCSGGTPSQPSDNNIRQTGGTVGDSANQTGIQVELLSDGCNRREIRESQLSIEATDNKGDLAGRAAPNVYGTSGIKSTCSDLLPGDTNGCHPKMTMFEKTESIACFSTSGITSATDKRAEEDVRQLGSMESPDDDSEPFWGTENDDIKPGSPLLALSQKSDPSSGSFQIIAADHQKVLGSSPKEDTLIPRSSISALGKGHLSPGELAIGETEFEHVESTSAFQEARRGFQDCLRRTTLAENSSGLPDLVNDIALLGALTQHSTALESLQKMEENHSLLYE